MLTKADIRAVRAEFVRLLREAGRHRNMFLCYVAADVRQSVPGIRAALAQDGIRLGGEGFLPHHAPAELLAIAPGHGAFANNMRRLAWLFLAEERAPH